MNKQTDKQTNTDQNITPPSCDGVLKRWTVISSLGCIHRYIILDLNGCISLKPMSGPTASAVKGVVRIFCRKEI